MVSARSRRQTGRAASSRVNRQIVAPTDSDSLRVAFEGASQVLLVSSNASAFGGDPVAQHRTAIDAACAAGTQRLLDTSHQAASPNSAFGPARHHAATEALLETAGVPFMRRGELALVDPTLEALLGRKPSPLS